MRNYQATLETSRLLLRPIAADDAAALHRISNEPDVRRYLWDDEPIEKETIRGFVSRSTRMFSEEGIGLFGIRRRGGESLIGFCGFVRLSGIKEPELAFELTRSAWGEGLATEASIACLRYAFERAALERVIAGADAENVASRRVIEKLGMRFVGGMNPNVPEAPYYAVYREEFLSAIEREDRKVEIEAKLKELGLVLPDPTRTPPGLVLPFSWVRVWKDRAYVSGHVALEPDGRGLRVGAAGRPGDPGQPQTRAGRPGPRRGLAQGLRHGELRAGFRQAAQRHQRLFGPDPRDLRPGGRRPRPLRGEHGGVAVGSAGGD
jgi:ribosomal-protein-alanine N-acetyltransferase